MPEGCCRDHPGDGHAVVKAIEHLTVKIFADGADQSQMLEMHAKPYIKGLTTNPTLMRKAGVANYRAFARDVLEHVRDKPVSFEVISDEFAQMERQALEQRLASRGVKVNVTAILTLRQVRDAAAALNPEVASYVSVLAGRVADSGIDPVPLMAAAVRMLDPLPAAELIWG